LYVPGGGNVPSIRGEDSILFELLAEGGELLLDLGEFLAKAGYFFF
jgi:hypothetical protein